MITAPIDFRISEEDGRRYAIIPFEQFQALVEACNPDDLVLPHEVVGRHLVDGIPLIKAWREYFGLTQAEVGRRLDVSQAQVAQWERPNAKLRHITLKKIASAMGLHVGQLTLDDEMAVPK